MKGIDALKAMEKGTIVKDGYGNYYKMESYYILHYMDGEWHRSEMDLNDWIIRDFELSSEPVEYKLTFFEAMCKANEGAIVSSEAYPKYKYIMKDGTLYYYEKYGIPSFVAVAESEMKLKWRVVEEEEE